MFWTKLINKGKCKFVGHESTQKFVRIRSGFYRIVKYCKQCDENLYYDHHHTTKNILGMELLSFDQEPDIYQDSDC